MKKILRVVLFLILVLTPLTLSTMVRCDYQVLVGQTFTYDILDAKVEIVYEGSTGSGNGYMLGSTPIGSNTQCLVNVTGVDPATHVNWTVSSGGVTELGQSSEADLFAFGFLMVYCLPLYEILGEMTVGDALTFISLGTGLILLPFWDTYYMYTDFNGFASDNFISSFKEAGPYDEVTMDGDFKVISNNAVFEWFLGGAILLETLNTKMDVQVNHQLRTVYSTSTGVLQGVKMDSHVKGTSNDKELELWVSYLAEIVGFDMDSYTFTPVEFTPGFEWFIAIGALSLVTIPIIIYKKRNK
ncbi:MAG: hypothetical protein FK733_16410 [Asgard group archaeon]|nr:hypothetical protein [Asgard group archaeon]